MEAESEIELELEIKLAKTGNDNLCIRVMKIVITAYMKEQKDKKDKESSSQILALLCVHRCCF